MSIPNVIFNIVIAALPLGWLWRIYNSKSRKIALGFVYAVAGFVVAIGALRLLSLEEYASSAEYTWDFIPIAILTKLENSSALICACLPALNPLLQFCLHGSFVPLPESRTRTRSMYSMRQVWPGQRDLSAEEAGELARITRGEAPRNYYQNMTSLDHSDGARHEPSGHKVTKTKTKKSRWTLRGEAGDFGADTRPGLDPSRKPSKGLATPKDSRFSDW